MEEHGKKWPRVPWNSEKSLLTVHEEGTWEVRGLEGDMSQQVNQGGKGASFSIVCWCPMLAPQGITKATLLVGKN